MIGKAESAESRPSEQTVSFGRPVAEIFPCGNRKHHGFIRGLENDIAVVAQNPLPKEDFVGMVVGERKFADKEMAGEAILAACKNYKGTEPMPVGEYRGFKDGTDL